MRPVRRLLAKTVSVLTVASFLLTSMVATAIPARADSVKRVALVVGNSKYVDDVKPLSNPVNDAADVAEALQGMGFDVTRVLDVDVDGFRKSLRTFAQKAKGADMALFYYAGHAMHFDEESYLMPVGVKLEDESAVRFDMISVEDDILGKTLRDVPLKILLLDACRDNPIASYYETSAKTRSLSGVRGLGPLATDRPKGELIAYATQPNQVAEDGDGRNSPFSAALKKHIAEPGVEIRTMLDEVSRDVKAATHDHQVPQVSVTLQDKVFLNPGESDRDVWLRIANSDDPARFTDFLARFPKSDFVAAARATLLALQREANAKRLEAEQAVKAETAAAEAAKAQEAARKQAEAAQQAARQREEADAEAARQKAAREAAEAEAQAVLAKQKEALRLREQQEQQAREDAARLEAASKEAARQEAARQQKAFEDAELAAMTRREQLRQQALLDAAARDRAAKEEADRQQAARVEAARIEAAQLAAVKAAEEAQKEARRQAEASAAQAAREKALQAEQEAARQAALRADLIRQEAERQAAAKAQHDWQDAQRDETRRYVAAREEAARRVAEQQEAAKRLAAKAAADSLAAAKAEADRKEAEQQQATRTEAAAQKALRDEAQNKLNAERQKEAEANRKRLEAARIERQQAEAKKESDQQAVRKAEALRQAKIRANEYSRQKQIAEVQRRTANRYADTRPVRIMAPAARQSAPAPAAEAPGCMTCGF